MQLFDFARPVLSDAREIGVEMTAEGRVDAFLLWWTIHMDSSCAEDATVHLSTTPGQLIYAQPLPETPGTGGASPLGCLGAVRGLGDYQDVAASQDHQAHEVWPSFPPPERDCHESNGILADGASTKAGLSCQLRGSASSMTMPSGRTT